MVAALQGLTLIQHSLRNYSMCFLNVSDALPCVIILWVSNFRGNLCLYFFKNANLAILKLYALFNFVIVIYLSFKKENKNDFYLDLIISSLSSVDVYSPC